MVMTRICSFLSVIQIASSLADIPVNLQNQHTVQSPVDLFQQLSKDCEELGISKFDVYGDYGSDASDSFLRRFESEVAVEFGKPDAVFMPSGVMAQNICLLINSRNTKSPFVCHHSSHLILHEQEAYRELLGMEPLVINTTDKVDGNGYSIPPMLFEDFNEAVEGYSGGSLSTLFLEIPHRELGGKCTPWDDIVRMRQLCDKKGIKFHCDGARIFEATSYYDDKSLAEIAGVFDSVYISFYKGLGGISGAMLLGSSEFCDEARKWLRRLGGNLYTLLPYAVSSWAGYRRNWEKSQPRDLSFKEKHSKLQDLVTEISKQGLVSFDPESPDVNMVHVYFRHNAEAIMAARDRVEEKLGIRVVNRVGIVSEGDKAYISGFRAKFEWTLGNSNGAIPTKDFLKAWNLMSTELRDED